MEELDPKITEAELRFWRVWIRDQRQCAAVMYKPSGASAAWEDLPRQGTPRELCSAIKVGDMVDTDFTGKITRHRVTERETKNTSQTGCMLRVAPIVERSTDAGNPFVGSNPWLDSAWFRPAKQFTGVA